MYGYNSRPEVAWTYFKTLCGGGGVALALAQCEIRKLLYGNDRVYAYSNILGNMALTIIFI